VIGRVISDYRVIEQLGGGMGVFLKPKIPTLAIV